MNIYLRELRANGKSFLFWCLGILALVGGGMGKYTGFDAADQSIMSFMDKVPKIVLVIFGMNGLDMGTAAGFYGVIYMYLLIMGAIYTAMLGAGIISKEERDKTSEFLFVKPVSRVNIISFKIMAALTYSILFNLASLVISLGIAAKVAVGEDLTRDLCLLSLAMLWVQFIFLFMGTGMASISKRPATSAGTTTTIILVTYLLSVVINLSEKLNVLKFLTPFQYFEARNIINGGSLDPLFMMLSLLIIGLSVAVTYVFFPKRDLSI